MGFAVFVLSGDTSKQINLKRRKIFDNRDTYVAYYSTGPNRDVSATKPLPAYLVLIDKVLLNESVYGVIRITSFLSPY